MQKYIKSGLDVTFNVFLVDEHVGMGLYSWENMLIVWNCIGDLWDLLGVGRSIVRLIRVNCLLVFWGRVVTKRKILNYCLNYVKSS